MLFMSIKCCGSTVPETFFPSWTVSERWAHFERTWTHSERTVSALLTYCEHALSEWWAHAERNSVNAYERWSMSKRRPQTERKVSGKRTVNDMWALCFVNARWTINSEYLGDILTLIFVVNQKKKTNKLHVQSCYRERWQNNPILYSIMQIISLLFYLIPYHLCLGIITVK